MCAAVDAADEDDLFSDPIMRSLITQASGVLSVSSTAGYLRVGPIEKRIMFFVTPSMREKAWRSRARVTPASSPASHCARRKPGL